MKTSRERQADHEKRRRQHGEIRVSVWLTPAQLAVLDGVRGRLSRTAYIRQLVTEHLDGPVRPQPDDQSSPPDPVP